MVAFCETTILKSVIFFIAIPFIFSDIPKVLAGVPEGVVFYYYNDIIMISAGNVNGIAKYYEYVLYFLR